MESYIQISKINDFLYCPMSVYLQSIHGGFSEKSYHQTPQVVGRINHEAIEKGTYSSARRFIVGLEVWCEEFGLMGKIDIYDQKEKTLIERKTKVKNIYPGYVYQLFAQYFALKEMGYTIEKLLIHSLADNKRHKIPLPTAEDKEEFAKVINNIKSFSIEEIKEHSCPKCANSIYGALGW